MSESAVKIKHEQEEGMFIDPNTLCKVSLYFVGSPTLNLLMCFGEIEYRLKEGSVLFLSMFYDSIYNRWLRLNYENLTYYTVESVDGEPLFIHKKHVKNEEK